MRKWWSSAPAATEVPQAPPGWRGYAIGDVHGRLDLLNKLLGKIERDHEARPPKKLLIVLLGDLIDRGPDSKGVVDRLLAYDRAGATLVFLAGNHEEVLLRLLAGEQGIFRNWLKFGGTQCLQSYGVDPSAIADSSERRALETIKKSIPDTHASFIQGFSDTLQFGDYLFVHAGIRPGVDLSLQSQSDLRWIRSPFLEDDRHHGSVIVHGHTITEQVEERINRIGLDTGAYRSGLLSALAVEGTDRWIIDTADHIEEEPVRAD